MGVVSRRKGRTAALVASSVLKGSRSLVSAGPITSARVSTRASVLSVWRSVPGSRAIVSERFVSSLASASKTLPEALTKRRSSAGWRPTSCMRDP
jgi:hypothetical protein